MSSLFTIVLLTCALSAHAKEGPPLGKGDQGFNTSDLEALLLTTMNVTNKDPSWTRDVPPCNWTNVDCNSGFVHVLRWSSMGLGGFPNLATLPQRLQWLSLSGNQFTGTPNLATLPQGLQWLYLSGNQFTGTPNLATLPEGLQLLWLYDNEFDGSGLFYPGADWCRPYMNPSTNMCGAGHDATFDCPGGTWTCVSSGSNAVG